MHLPEWLGTLAVYIYILYVIFVKKKKLYLQNLTRVWVENLSQASEWKQHFVTSTGQFFYKDVISVNTNSSLLFIKFEDVPLVEFMYVVFTRRP